MVGSSSWIRSWIADQLKIALKITAKPGRAAGGALSGAHPWRHALASGPGLSSKTVRVVMSGRSWGSWLGVESPLSPGERGQNGPSPIFSGAMGLGRRPCLGGGVRAARARERQACTDRRVAGLGVSRRARRLRQTRGELPVRGRAARGSPPSRAGGSGRGDGPSLPIRPWPAAVPVLTSYSWTRAATSNHAD
jgi:hypothetical protein